MKTVTHTAVASSPFRYAGVGACAPKTKGPGKGPYGTTCPVSPGEEDGEEDGEDAERKKDSALLVCVTATHNTTTNTRVHTHTHSLHRALRRALHKALHRALPGRRCHRNSSLLFCLLRFSPLFSSLVLFSFSLPCFHFRRTPPRSRAARCGARESTGTTPAPDRRS